MDMPPMTVTLVNVRANLGVAVDLPKACRGAPALAPARWPRHARAVRTSIPPPHTILALAVPGRMRPKANQA